MRPLWFTAVLVACLGGWAALSWRFHRQTSVLRSELAAYEAQGSALSAARMQNEALRARQPPPDEIVRLRQKHAELEQRQRRTAAPAAEAAGADGVEPPRTAAADWEWRGRKTPEATLESALWAANRQDTQSLAPLLFLAPKGKAELATLFARLPEAAQRQYGSPEGILATLVTANLPEHLEAMTTQAVSMEGPPDTNHAVLSLQLEADGRTGRVIGLGFQKSPNGWQVMVPTSFVEEYARQLTGNEVFPAPPRAPAASP